MYLHHFDDDDGDSNNKSITVHFIYYFTSLQDEILHFKGKKTIFV